MIVFQYDLSGALLSFFGCVCSFPICCFVDGYQRVELAKSASHMDIQTLPGLNKRKVLKKLNEFSLFLRN